MSEIGAQTLLYGRRQADTITSTQPSARVWREVAQLERRLQAGDRLPVIAVLNEHRAVIDTAPAVSRILTALAADLVDYDPSIVGDQGIDIAQFSAQAMATEAAVLVSDMAEQLIDLLDDGELDEDTIEDLTDGVSLQVLALSSPGPWGQAQLVSLLGQFSQRWGHHIDRTGALEMLTAYAEQLDQYPLLRQLADGWAEQMLQPASTSVIDLTAPTSRGRELACMLGFEPRYDPAIIRSRQARSILHLAPERERTLCGRSPQGWVIQPRGSWAEAREQSRCRRCARLGAELPSVHEPADFSALSGDEMSRAGQAGREVFRAMLVHEPTLERLQQAVRQAARFAVDQTITERLLREPLVRQWSRLMESARMPSDIIWPKLTAVEVIHMLSAVETVGCERQLRWAAHAVLCDKLGWDAQQERQRLLAHDWWL